jgi:hypothetical protein
MEIKSTDLSARLLATENISVLRANTQTASFDIQSRVLTLPLWKEMTPEIEDMLVGHEVGHALYTGEKYMEPIKENRKMMSYLNILEDVRIEKLIKRKYPGLRKRMNEGYKQLNDRDFFGISKVQSFDDLLLIDKINLYFKAGYNCGVTFNPEERTFIYRAEHTETVEDVIQLAKEVYAYSKEQLEKKLEEIKESLEEDQEELSQDEKQSTSGKGDWDPEEEYDEETNHGIPDVFEEQSPVMSDDMEKLLESITEKTFSSKLNELADSNTTYVYWKFDNEFYKDPVIDYKRVLNETVDPDAWTEEQYEYYSGRYRSMEEDERSAAKAKYDAEFNAFKSDSARTVNYLVKEFEMKKSADVYKRAKISKIGSLDMRKIYAYTLKDDLFKRVTMLPQGKNHGMVMLVDWSGSMNHVLKSVLEQVINLAMFCRRVQIPFRVLAFTSDYNKDQDDWEKYRAWRDIHDEKLKNSKEKFLNTARQFNLLELLSDKMTQAEFNIMSRRLLHYSFIWNKGYGTGGTPLNEALAWIYENLGKFIKKNNLQKTTFITLTDGEGSSLSGYNSSLVTSDYVWDETENRHKSLNIKNFILDPVTQKTYFIDRYSNQQTETILNMIKDRYGVTMVGFHLTDNRRRDLVGAIRANLPDYNGNIDLLIEQWKKQFRADGVAVVKNAGRDELYIVPQSSTQIDEGDLKIDANSSSKIIARNFTKFMNVKKTSRVLLNRFVSLVA